MAAKTPRTGRVNRGSGHSYYVDGKKVDGVTTVIGNGLPKPALMAWGPKVVAQYVADRLKVVDNTRPGGPDDRVVVATDLIADLAEVAKKNRKPFGLPYSATGVAEVLKGVHYEQRDEAARKGTAVHDYAERLAAGEDVTVPKVLAGHVDAYLAFRDAFDPTDELLERVVISRTHSYMGTLDIIATIRLPRDWVEDNLPDLDLEDRIDPDTGDVLVRCLIDIKTSRSGPFGEVALQLAGYRYAETMLDDDAEEVPMPEVDACFVLWLRGDGFDLYPFTAGPLEFRLFLYVQQVAWFQEEHSRTLRGDSVPVPATAEEAPA